jgi:hypothetical protein
MHTVFWLRNLKGRDHLKDLRMGWGDNIKMDLREIMWQAGSYEHGNEVLG